MAAPSMSLQLRIALVTTGFALMSSAGVGGARAQQKVLTNDQRQIADTVNTVLTALRTNDAATLNSVIAPDFYIFDGGTRFNGGALMALIKAQHVAGKHYEWNVTEPDVHISGNTARIAYVNHQQCFRSGETTLVRIGLLAETGGRLEGPLYPQHKCPNTAAREPQMTNS